jgi:DNA-binding GntR family transcriptional regulator
VQIRQRRGASPQVSEPRPRSTPNPGPSQVEDNANDHHAEILTAIRHKDGELAAATMAEHINETRHTIESWLSR